MRFLILLIPILALAGEPALPRDLETLKTSYDRDLEKLKADHDAAVLKRTDAYRMKLLDVQTTLTKAGDLDGALAAKRMAGGLPMFAVPEKPKDPQEPGPDAKGRTPLSLLTKATWGSGNQVAEITSRVKGWVQNKNAPAVVGGPEFGDPAPNKVKVLVLECSYQGRTRTKVFHEGSDLDLDKLFYVDRP